MKIAFIVLAHDNPEQLGRLVNRLKSDQSEILIHVDAKSAIQEFEAVIDRSMLLHDRIPVYWGDFSQIAATLSLIRGALQRKPDYVVFLSGTHYPLCSTAEIEDYLESNAGFEFINCVRMPSVEASKSLDRLKAYSAPPTLKGRLQRRLRDALVIAGIIPRHRDYEKVLKEIVPHAGSQWWALSGDACRYILEFAAQRPDFIAFFRNAVVPDEMVIQTILANSSFCGSMRPAFTYSDWASGAPSPATISGKHIDAFARNNPLVLRGVYGESKALFCRKVTSKEISDQIDALIDRRSQRT